MDSHLAHPPYDGRPQRLVAWWNVLHPDFPPMTFNAAQELTGVIAQLSTSLSVASEQGESRRRVVRFNYFIPALAELLIRRPHRALHLLWGKKAIVNYGFVACDVPLRITDELREILSAGLKTADMMYVGTSHSSVKGAGPPPENRMTEYLDEAIQFANDVLHTEISLATKWRDARPLAWLLSAIEFYIDDVQTPTSRDAPRRASARER
ncbi:unnamed protein product [Vitrella brassicaformis CCMP3155]|uniref:Uncharacterized protein n=1 Tax=Vitrella brassicaformis (strain CCMP3155) TaxID=1169540 RepID=A0A0G4EVK8_VITBC|nr:unnamed protein product [Vitrella brassicaformis CCMP3155]|eukprot:CEM02319.1 unnamed protein product [Vitrella brassicaformis CCMP3155]